MQNMPLIINLNLFSCKIQDLIYSLDQLKVMCVRYYRLLYIFKAFSYKIQDPICSVSLV